MLESNRHHLPRRFFTSENSLSYDSVVKYATFNQDARWKKQISILSNNSKSVLDLACGTGVLSKALHSQGTRIIAGLDLTWSYLQLYTKRMTVPVTQGTAELLPFRDNTFDAVVSSYLAKYVELCQVVTESHRVLKPGGLLLFHDFSAPSNELIKVMWRIHFALLQVFGYLTSSWLTVFRELREVIETSNWINEALRELELRGFKEVSTRSMTWSTSCIVSGRKK